MRVFVTGASGYIGSAVVSELSTQVRGRRPGAFGRLGASLEAAGAGSSAATLDDLDACGRRSVRRWSDPPGVQPRLLRLRRRRPVGSACHRDDR